MNYLTNDKNKWALRRAHTASFSLFTKHNGKRFKKTVLTPENFEQKFNRKRVSHLFFLRHSTVCSGLSQSNLPETSFSKENTNFNVRRYIITGARRVSNYWWASVISLGGFAFLLTGFSAFFQKRIFVFSSSASISFFPQGLIMCFYGGLGLFFGIYLWCTILWEVGNGFNEFQKKQGIIRIFRWGLPGKKRRIDLVYKIEQVEGVRVELVEGINPRRTIYLRFKSNIQKKNASLIPPQNKAAANSNSFVLKQTSSAKRDQNTALNNTIPLTRIGQPIGLEDIESEASELAQFLQVPLDSFYEL